MRYFRLSLLLLLPLLATPRSHAGGSGLNTVVVVNPASSNSLALGNYYAERRGLPPQNVFRLAPWTGSRVAWTLTDFNDRLARPLIAALQARDLTQQVWQVVLSMDIPYRVDQGGSQWNSTTAALFYGFKNFTAAPPGLPQSCSLPEAAANSYAFSELPFPDAPPATAATNAFITFMLTSDTLAQAKAIVERGVASDGSFPTQLVWLAKTTDTARSVRFYTFDHAIFNARVLGDNAILRTNSNAVSFPNSFGLQTGLANFTIAPNTFVPGAMADSLTSYGGTIFNSQGQTTLLAFLDAGATASYGTVVEPCNYLEKFPDPRAYFYQARGFSIGESYYQSLSHPFEGLFVGDPLAQPFVRPSYLGFMGLSDGQIVGGTTIFSVEFEANDSANAIGQMDLFVNGTFHRTLTNRTPAAGNMLTVILGSRTVNYTVPVGATVPSVASGLAAALNAQSGLTGVAAYPQGDRIELQSLNVGTVGAALPTSASSVAGPAPQRTTFVRAAQSAFLDSSAFGLNRLSVSNAPQTGNWIRLTLTKTNGQSFSFSVTNNGGGTITSLMQSLANQINASPALQSADGAIAEDFFSAEPGRAWAGFLLRARNPGWTAAQILAQWDGSPNLLYLPGPSTRLDGNWPDLRPRNHLYLAAGALVGTPAFALDTTELPDGHHELTVVSYEGNSVRTQSRATRRVRVQNTPLLATLTPVVGGPLAALEGTLQWRVEAGPGDIASLELFSTGGSLGASNGVASATFEVSGAYLGEGQHPFYALATDSLGRKYRTETQWVRLTAAQPPFTLTMEADPLALTWEAVAGRNYQIEATASLAQPLLPVATMIASNQVARWPILNPALAPGFFRVSTVP